MASQSYAAAGQRPNADGVRYTMRAATVRHDDTTTPIHLVAASQRSALGYGAERLRVGAPIVLTVDALELTGRIGWTDGRRFRVDAELGDDGELWALLDRAPGGGERHVDAYMTDAA